MLASGACALAYLALLLTQGYGANSRFYPTPWDHPAEWFACLAGMLSIGPVSLATPLPSDLAFMLPELWLPAVLGCALVLALCVRPAWRGLRGATGAGFLGAWFLLALLPSTGAPLSDRLLFGASFGSAGLLAIWIERALASGLRGARIGAGVLLVCGLPLAGLANAGRLIELARMSKSCEAVLRDMQLPTSGSDGWRDALILQRPNPLLGINASAARQHITEEHDARLWPLQLGRRALELTREDERTLVLRSLDEPFLHDPIEALFRSWEDELALGRRWDTALFEVEALELEDDGLRALRLRSAKTIDDPSLALLYWNGARLASVPAPAVGETLTLERCQADSVFLP